MGLSSLAFLTHECVLNIRRNGLMSIAALGTVTVALTVLGASVWTAERVHEIAERQPDKFNEVDVFLKTDATRQQALAAQRDASALPNVSSVRLVTREEAWARLRANNPALTDAMPENPLPDTLEVIAANPAQLDQVTTAMHDRNRFPVVAAVNDSNKVLRDVLGFARIIRVIGGAAAGGLFAATFFIVYNTIRLTVFARRHEIRIMQLVGATPGFIRFPLLLEGLLYGAVGAVIASGIIIACAHQVSGYTSVLHSPLLGDVPARLHALDVLAGLIAVGIVVGLVGSHFSVRRYLRQV